MRLFSNILNTRAQLGTRILQKNKTKQKKYKLCKTNVYDFALD